MRLAGRHALVTGGGTGIGAAIARALAAEGAKVTVIGRRIEPVERIAREIGGVAISADVTDGLSVKLAFEKAYNAQGPIEILINNAGAAAGERFGRVTEQVWRDAMAVNLDAVYLCSHWVMPEMLRNGWGRIVTIASNAGLRGYAYVAAYVAAKHGAVGLMRALATEFADSGVTCNAICPGFTETEIVAETVQVLQEKTGRTEQEARDVLARYNLSKRLIAPAEVAEEVVRMILSDRSGLALEIS
jgi:NAD(P)-dependent dehydrogenase (short-subunit alcohol dehydrogenase family)